MQQSVTKGDSRLPSSSILKPCPIHNAKDSSLHFFSNVFNACLSVAKLVEIWWFLSAETKEETRGSIFSKNHWLKRLPFIAGQGSVSNLGAKCERLSSYQPPNKTGLEITIFQVDSSFFFFFFFPANLHEYVFQEVLSSKHDHNVHLEIPKAKQKNNYNSDF